MKSLINDPSNSPRNDHDEVTFFDIVSFLARSWKKLLLAILIGCGLGLGFGFLIGTYSAQSIFFSKIQNAIEPPLPRSTKNFSGNEANPSLNPGLSSSFASLGNRMANSGSTKHVNPGQSIQQNPFSLDLSAWKAIQKSLPSLATQMLASGVVGEDQRDLFLDLAKESWWRKNVVPNFLAISKSETKDLAGTLKDLESDNFVLMSLTITETGRTAESALKNAQGAVDFLRYGGAFIQVRNLLNSYESEVIGSVPEIQKQITSAKIEISFLSKRLNQLEDLRKRFPNTSPQSQLLVEANEASAKYLPLTTQIIATQNEIHASNELIDRLNQRLVQLKVIERFLNEAKVAASSNFNGLTLVDQLLVIEKNIRPTIPKTEIGLIEILDQIRSQLLEIQARFAGGLEPVPSIKSTGLIQAILAGTISTFFLALFWLIGRESWLNARPRNPVNR